MANETNNTAQKIKYQATRTPHCIRRLCVGP